MFRSVRPLIRPAVFASFVLILVLTTLAAIPVGQGPRNTSGPGIGQISNIVTRWQTWGGVVEVIKQSPVVGSGIGTSARKFSIVHQEQGLPGGLGRSGHNLYLEWVAETGAFGGLAMFVLIFLTIRTLMYVRKTAQAIGDSQIALYSGALLVALPGFMVLYIFDSAFKDFMYFFMLLSLSFVMLRILKSSPSSK